MNKPIILFGVTAGFLLTANFSLAQALSPTTYTIDPALLNSLSTISPTTSTTTPSTSGTTTSPTGSTTTTNPTTSQNTAPVGTATTTTPSTVNTTPPTQTTAPVGTATTTAPSTVNTTPPTQTTAPAGTATTSTSQTSSTNTGILVLPSTTPPRTTNPIIPPVIPVNCPATPANSTQPSTTCPTPEAPQPVIPNFPTALMITPLAAVIVFWLILAFLNNTQLRTQNHLNQIKSTHQQTRRVSASRQEPYQHLLDFLTAQLGSGSALDLPKFENLRARIQLFGSAEMQNICNSLSQSFQKNDRAAVKTDLKKIITQIKAEL